MTGTFDQLLKSPLKKQEEVEVPEIYLTKIRECWKNPTPFQIIENADILDWGEALKPYFLKTLNSIRAKL